MSTTSLATIMFTDLVDSTGQRSRIGDDAADAIVTAHDGIVAGAAERHGGRIIKTLGDGALAVFPSALDAVQAGVAITHEAGAATGSGGSGDLSIRVGIHAGEVAVSSDDISGLPVAVAARVCSVAEGGQVVVTSIVRSLLGNRGDIALHPLGAHDLKGVSTPVELWGVLDGDAPDPVDDDRPVAFPAFLARGVPASLVGRDEQLARLDTAHAAATAGRPTFAAVVGEPGIGKTALTSTWTNKVAAAGGVVLGGRCTPDARLPYQPFIEIARSVLDANPGRLSDLGSAAGNVAVLVPSVPAPPGLPAPAQADPDTMRYLMAEAFVTLMAPRPDEPATVVVLDDLHWADDASIEVLAHLARRDDERRLMVIGTYRDTDLVRSHPLPRLLADLRRDRRIERIMLDPLETGEIAAMVSVRVGAELERGLIDSIAAETKGNPLFVAEMVAHLVDDGAIDAQGRWASDIPIEDYGIPEGLRDVIGRRIERLGEDALPFLEAASVIGPTFVIDVAASVAGIDIDAADEIVDRAIAAQLFTEGDTVDEAAFAHALVRQTLYDEVPTRRRVRLHRAVGDALEAAGAPATDALPHWLIANVSDRALPAALTAATEARTVSGQADAMRHLELALDLWDDVDDPEAVTGTTHAELVIELSTFWGDFAIDPARALELIDAEIDATTGDPTTLARLYTRKSDHLWQAGDIAGSEALLEQALDTIDTDRPSPELAVLQSNRSGRLMTSGHFHRAADEARRALEIVQELGDDAPLAAEMRAVTVLGSALLSIGQVEDGERWFERLGDLAETTGNVRAGNTRFMNQGEGYRINGRFEDALALSDAGVARSIELGADRWESALTANAAEVLFLMGRWDEAGERLDALPVSADLDYPELSVIGKRIVLAAERGEDDVVEALLERLDGYDFIDQEQQVNATIYEALIAHHRWNGRWDDAFAAASDAMSTWSDIADLTEGAPPAARAVGVVADAVDVGAERDGWLDHARIWNDHLQRSKMPDPFVGVWKAFAAAELARAEGTDDAGLWRAAVAAAGERPYVRALGQWRLAIALARNNPTDPEIPDLIESSHATAEHLGARPLLDALTALPD